MSGINYNNYSYAMKNFSLPAMQMSMQGLTPADTGNIFWQPVIQPPQIDFSYLEKMNEIYLKNQKNFIENWMSMMKNFKLPAFNQNNMMYPMGNYSDSDTTNFTYDAKELKSKWSKKKPNLSDGFYNKVVAIAKRIGCSPDDLMALMNSESGISASAVNKHGGATGLIQFMPKTARSLGTTTEALKLMTPEQQLVYVEKYLMKAKKSAGFSDNDKIGAGTLYTLVFLPAYARKDVLACAGHIYYDSNRGLDVDGDGGISKADLARRLQSFSA